MRRRAKASDTRSSCDRLAAILQALAIAFKAEVTPCPDAFDSFDQSR